MSTTTIQTKPCPCCSVVKTLTVPAAGLRAYRAGAHVQDAFPLLPGDDRERLISGTCPPCWDKMFKEEDSPASTELHTPSPWRVVERETLEDGGIYPLHITGGARSLTVVMMETLANAELPWRDGMAEAAGDIRSKRANARLIAAAPDMLEALKRLLHDIDEAEEVGSEPYTRAHAAIAKAAGRG